MPYQPYAVTRKKMGLKSKALAANMEEFPHFRPQVDRLAALLALLQELTAEQARLTAARQEVSKQIAELTDEAQKLMTVLDAVVREHYGKSSEKLAEYGLQPFRRKPRARRVEPDGQPLERNAVDADSPASPETE